MNNKTILVTGCSGLVGTFLLEKLISRFNNSKIIGVDLKPLQITIDNDRFTFENVNLIEDGVIEMLFKKYKPDYVINSFGITLPTCFS